MPPAYRMTFLITQFPAFDSSILASQVYNKARLLSELGWSCQFIGSDITERCTKKNIEKLKKKYSFSKIDILPVFPRNPSFIKFNSMLKKNHTKIIDLLKGWNPEWTYFRNLFEFEAFHKDIKKVDSNCLYDFRAILSNEVRHNNPGLKSLIKEYWIYTKEKKTLRKADYLFCVSNNLKTWVEKTSGRKDIYVIPSCTDPDLFKPDKEARLKRRAQLNWEKDVPVVVYSGGDSYWQRPSDTVGLLKRLKNKISNLKVLILTGQVDFFQQELTQNGFVMEDFHVRNVSHDDVSSWLNVADAGIVLRHDILLNNVASPIKIGEYLSCGLPVICTAKIGDYSQAIGNADAGVVLDDTLFDFELVTLLTDQHKREKCKKNALQLSKRYSKKYEREVFKTFLETSGLGVYA